MTINNTDVVFDEYGDYVRGALDDCKALELPTLHQNELSKKTNIMSQSAISLAYHGLTVKGIIELNANAINLNDLPSSGYFELLADSGLKGELLIFYSWLKNLSKNNPIVSSMKRLADMYGNAPMANIRDYLFRLRKKGLIERDERNNLIVK